MKMNLCVKGIKHGKSSEVSEYFTNHEEYATSAIYQKVKENGRETIRGYFYSAKKGINNAEMDKEKTVEIYSANNQSDGERKSLGLKEWLKLLSIFFIISLIVIDISSYFKSVSGGNEIEKYNCEKEYKENECDKVTVNDGPILNNFCKEREFCINIKYNNVYMHTVIVKMIQDIVLSIMPSSLLQRILTVAGLFVGLILIKYI